MTVFLIKHPSNRIIFSLLSHFPLPLTAFIIASQINIVQSLFNPIFLIINRVRPFIQNSSDIRFQFQRDAIPFVDLWFLVITADELLLDVLVYRWLALCPFLVRSHCFTSRLLALSVDEEFRLGRPFLLCSLCRDGESNLLRKSWVKHLCFWFRKPIVRITQCFIAKRGHFDQVRPSITPRVHPVLN